MTGAAAGDPGPMPVLVLLAGGENARMESLRGTIYKGFLPIHGVSLVARHALRAHAFGIPSVDVIVDERDGVLGVLSSPEVARGAGGSGGPAGSGGEAPADIPVRVLVNPGSPAQKILWWYDRHGDTAMPVLVALGDTLAAVDYAALTKAARSGEFDSAIGLARVRLPFGEVRLTGDRVSAFVEKPVLTTIVHTGHMALGPGAMALLRSGATLPDMLGRLAERGKLMGWTGGEEGMIHVDSLESLASAHRLLRDKPPGREW
jgi:NDP-sugar pyrophosphorylase family protein